MKPHVAVELRTCPICFRELCVRGGVKGKYPKHKTSEKGKDWCPVSGRNVTNNGVVM